jgi:hypothetical protein
MIVIELLLMMVLPFRVAIVSFVTKLAAKIKVVG